MPEEHSDDNNLSLSASSILPIAEFVQPNNVYKLVWPSTVVTHQINSQVDTVVAAVVEEEDQDNNDQTLARSDFIQMDTEFVSRWHLLPFVAQYLQSTLNRNWQQDTLIWYMTVNSLQKNILIQYDDVVGIAAYNMEYVTGIMTLLPEERMISVRLEYQDHLDTNGCLQTTCTAQYDTQQDYNFMVSNLIRGGVVAVATLE